MASIFLFSEQIGKCIELENPEIRTSDLVDLQGMLPRNLKGLSFYRPTAVRSGDLSYRCEHRDSRVSRYLGNVGEKLLGLGQLPGALRFFDLALRIRQDPQVGLLRAQALVGLGRLEEAQRELEQLLRGESRNGVAHFLMGKIYLSRNDYQSAQGFFQQADRFLPEAHPYRAVVSAYLRFNQVFLDRDALYGKDLSPENYVREIEQLQARVGTLRSQVEGSPDAEIRGMEPYLDQLSKLFQCWLAEIQHRQGPASA